MADSNSVNGTMFSGLPATQRYKVHPCAIDTHGVDLPGTFRLNASFLHTQMADSNSVNGAMSSSLPAFERYMLYLYAMNIHGVAHQYVLRIFLVLSDSTPDSSTTRQPIPILSKGQCPAPSQLSNGICYIST